MKDIATNHAWIRFRLFKFSLHQGLCDVTPEGFAHLTHMLMSLAAGKVVLVLEVLHIYIYIQYRTF